MPLVPASVCSIIAVPKVNYYTLNSEAILLPLCYKIDELQSSKKKKKKVQHRSFESEIAFFLVLHLNPYCPHFF